MPFSYPQGMNKGVSSSVIETLGVDTIPESERTGKPRDIFTFLFGGNLALSVMVFGSVAISYGLSWWATASAIVAGTFVGSIIVLPLSLLGYRSATNNSVSSGAFFGVRGRLVASGVGLLICLGYIALTIWTGGDALSAVVERWLGWKATNTWSGISYGIIAILIVVVAIIGYHWLDRANKLIIPIVLVTIVLSLIAFHKSFSFSYPGTSKQLALGTFWPTWILAALTAGAAGPISYVTLLGDWSRYISPARHSKRAVLYWSWVGLFKGLIIPTLFGAYLSEVAFDPNSFVAGVVKAAPSWLLLPLIVIGVVGSVGQGALNLYSMGLDFDAILPALKRWQSTFIMAAIAVLLVFLGKFVWDAQNSVTNFVLFLTAMATPWAAITTIGYFTHKGEFDSESLQVFNRRVTGGKYWFTAGWNLPTIGAWVAGCVVGILSVSTTSYEGPIAHAFSGVVASPLTSGATAGLIYWVISRSTRL